MLFRSGGYCVTVDQPMERRAFYVFDGVFSSLPRRGVDKARLFVFSAGSVFVRSARPFLLRFAGRKMRDDRNIPLGSKTA